MSVVGAILIAVVLVVVLIAGGVAGDLVARDPGYVLITYDGLALETSLWVALVALFLLLFVLWLAGFLLARALRSWGMLGRWSSGRRQRGAATRTTQGLLLLAEGQWTQAQRALEAAAPNAQAPLANYLAAARAASAQGLSEQRDGLLRQARQSTPGSALAVGLVQAELQQQNGEWAQSLTLLNDMREASPRHPTVLRLYVLALQALQQVDELQPLLADVKKSKALGKAEFAELETSTYLGLLGKTVDAETLHTWYQSLPKAQRTNTAIMSTLGGKVVALQQAAVNESQVAALAEFAEPILRGAIDKLGDSVGSAALLQAYGQLEGQLPARQQSLQRWQKKMPQHEPVLIAAAQVAAAQGDLVGAQTRLEEAVTRAPHAQAYLQLAQLCCAQGDAESALKHLAQAQQISANGDLLALAIAEPPEASATEVAQTTDAA